jgi:hypothetical protein
LIVVEDPGLLKVTASASFVPVDVNIQSVKVKGPFVVPVPKDVDTQLFVAIPDEATVKMQFVKTKLVVVELILKTIGTVLARDVNEIFWKVYPVPEQSTSATVPLAD